jgi:hypothetical protein
MVGAWAVIAGRIKPPAHRAAPTASPTGTGGAGPSQPASTGPAQPTGSTAPSSPSGPPGPVDVSVAPALQPLPATPEVVTLLSAYFTAIDQRDFAALRQTLVPRAGLPSTEAEFRSRYKSTMDSDVRLVGLRTGPDRGMVASVSFTSHQDAADAPDGVSPCLRWSIGYPLVRVGGGLRIDEVGKSDVVRLRC